MIRAVLLELPDLADEGTRLRLEDLDLLLKAGFDPDQPRDADGRWAGDGSSAAMLRQAFEAAEARLLPDGGRMADTSGRVPDISMIGSQGHHFRFVLNGQNESALECLDCDAETVRFPAFSGRRDTGAIDDAAQTAAVDEGPLPVGRYFIVDRVMGRAEQIWSHILPHHNDWFALLPVPAAMPDDGDWNDSLMIDGVPRGSFRLHPEGPRGLSEGCITITGFPSVPDSIDPDIEPAPAAEKPQGTVEQNYGALRQLLLSTPQEYLPSSRRRVYGTVDVVGVREANGR